MAYASHTAGSRRITTIAGVALIHGVIGYALVTGMAVDVARTISRTLTTTNIALPEPPPPPTVEPQPARPSAQTATQPKPAETTLTITPIIEAPASTNVVHVDAGPAPLDVPLPPTIVEPQPPAVSKAAGVRARGDRSGWITTADYPSSAIRAEEQGVVGISIQIDGDGRVTSCTVTRSSGSSALDDVTCRLYQRRARFEPARDAGGNAIASTYVDRIRWELPR